NIKVSMEDKATSAVMGKRRRVSLISWKAPKDDWVKANIDGSVIEGSFLAAAGGVIKDSIGTWKGGFAIKIGIGSKLIERDWEVFVKHVYLVANLVIDFMAEVAMKLSFGCHRFYNPSGGLDGWLKHDIVDVAYPRSVVAGL
ncbi:conserved hypothetical protein, partial [Ricinus communis]